MHWLLRSIRYRLRAVFSKLRFFLAMEPWLIELRRNGINISSLHFKGRPWDQRYFNFNRGVHIEEGNSIWISECPNAEPYLNLGDRVFIGKCSYLGVHCPISIGANTIIGAYSYIISADHCAEDPSIPTRDQVFVGAPISIGENVWIGAHVVILKGIQIGHGAIIGAGSVVTKNIPANEIWGGVPARFIKSRK